MNELNNMKATAKQKANDLYKEGKDKTETLAHQLTEGMSNLYAEGKQKVHNLENNIGECSEELVKTIKDKPITSVLIAAGVGMLLSHILKK